MSRSIFFIGQCRLDLSLNIGATSAVASPGGNMLNAAMLLSRQGRNVAMVGEAATDYAGHALVSALERDGVDTSCIDRYPDGATMVNIIAPDDFKPHSRIYTNNPREKLVLKWPRINAGDIVVFGNWFALDPRTHDAIAELVAYAHSRRATLIYLPGFAPQLQPAITHVMPAILDYLEIADLVVMFNDDHRHLFGAESAKEAYRRSINFYCATAVSIAAEGAQLFTDLNSEPIIIDKQQTTDASLLASLICHLANVDPELCPDPQLHPKHLSQWKALR